MKRSSRWTLITSLVCSTFIPKETMASPLGCSCPTVFSNNTTNSYDNCWDTSYQTSGCNGGCSCSNTGCAGCAWLGAVNNINQAGQAGAACENPSLILCTNAASQTACNTTSGGFTIAFDSSSPLYDYPWVNPGCTFPIATFNANQLITVTDNSGPILELQNGDFSINPYGQYIQGSQMSGTVDSAITFQGATFWVGTGSADVTLTVYGVNDGYYQWSGNEIVLNGSGGVTAEIIYGPGKTNSASDYPTNYNDTFALTESTCTIANGSGQVLTLLGSIFDNGGPGALVLLPYEPIALTGSNTYSDGTTLELGTLQIGSNSALGSGPLTVTGATVQIIAPGLTLGSGADFFINGTTTLDLHGNAFTLNMIFSSSVSPPGNLFIEDTVGGGSLSLAQNSSGYSGSVQLNSGKAILEAAGALGVGSFTFNGGTIALGNGSAVSSSIGISNVVYVNTSGGFDVAGNQATSTDFYNFTGAFYNATSTPGVLTISNSATSPGSVTISGPINYTGQTSISSSSASVTLVLDLPSTAPNVATSSFALGSNGTLAIQNAVTLPSVTGSSGTLLFDTASTQTTVSLNAPVSVGTLQVALESGVSLQTNGNSVTGSNVSILGNLDLPSSNNIITVTGIASQTSLGNISGLGSFSIQSGGSIGFSGSNTFSGGITLGTSSAPGGGITALSDTAFGVGTITSNGGTCTAGNSGLSVLGPNWNLASWTTTFNCSASGGCGTFALGNLSVSSNVALTNDVGSLLSFNSLSIPSGDTLQISAGAGVSIGYFGTDNSGNLQLAGTLTIASTTSSVFSGAISDYTTSGALGIQAPLTLQGTNAFTGGIILGSGGNLSVTSSSNLSTGTITGNGGTLSINGAGFSVSNPWVLNGGTTTTFVGNIGIQGSMTIASGGALGNIATIASIGSGPSFNLASLDVTNSTTLQTNGNSITVNGFGGGTGTIDLGQSASSSGTTGITDTITIAGSGLSFYGSLQDIGNGGVGVVNVTGSVFLGAANTFSGGLTLNGGSVTLGANNAASSGSIYSNGGTVALTASEQSLNNSWILATATTNPTTTISCSGGCSAPSLGTFSTQGSASAVLQNSTGSQLNLSSIVVASGTTLTIAASSSGIKVGTLSAGSGNLFLSGTLTIDSSTASSLPANILDASSAGSLVVNAPITLSGTNTFTGGVTLAGNILSVTQSGNLPQSGTFTGNGGSLYNVGSSVITMTNPWVLNGGDTTTFSGLITLTGPLSVSGTSGSTATIASNVAGLNLGTSASPISTLTIPSNLTLSTNGHSMVITNFGTGSGTLSLGSASIIDTLTISSTANTSFSGNIVDASAGSARGALVVYGTVTLSGGNTFSGGLTLNQGNITANSSNALGTGNVSSNGGTISFGVGGFSLTTPWSFVANSSNAITTFNCSAGGGCSTVTLGSASTSLASGLASGAATIVNNIGGMLSFTSLNIASATTLTLNSGASTGVTIGTFGSGSGALLLNGTLTISSSSSSTFGGNLQDMNTSASQVGTIIVSAPLTLNGNNTFSGGLTLSNNSLKVGSNTALGTGTVTSLGGTFSPTNGSFVSTNPWVFVASSGGTTTTLACAASLGCSTMSLGSTSTSLASSSTSGFAEIVNSTGIPVTLSSVNIIPDVILKLSAGPGMTVGTFGSGSGTLALAGSLTISSTTASTFTGIIEDFDTATSQIGVLNIQAPLTLSGVNTFTGGITFSANSLTISSASNLGSSSATFVGAGGGLVNSTSTQITVTNPWTLNGGATTTFGGPILLTGPITVAAQGNNSKTTLAKYSSGLVLTPSSVNIPSGTTLNTNGNSLTVGGSVGSGTLSLGATDITDTLTINAAATVSWTINDSSTANAAKGAVVVNSATTLTAANSFTGGLTLNNVTLTANNTSALGGGTITTNGGTVLFGVNSFSTGNSWVINTGFTTNLGCVSGSCSTISLGPWSIAGSGIAVVNNNAGVGITLSSLNINSGSTLELSAAAGVSIGSFGSGTGSLLLGGPLTVASNTSSTFAGVLADLGGGSTGSLVVKAPLTLTGTNTFTGGITLGSSTLTINNAGNLGSSSATIIGGGGAIKNSGTSVITISNAWDLLGGATTTFGGALTLTGPLSVTGSSGTTATIAVSTVGLVLQPSTLDIGSGLFLATGGNNITVVNGFGTDGGTLILGANNTTDTLTITSSSGSTFFGNIVNTSQVGGAGAVVVSGNVILSGDNTFSGGLTLSGGTITAGNASALGTGSIISNGGAISLGVSPFSITNPWTLNTSGSGLTTTLSCSATGGCSTISLGSISTGGSSGSALLVNNTGVNLTVSSLNVLTNTVLELNAAGTITTAGFGSGTGELSLYGTLVVDSTTASTFAGNLTDLSGSGAGSLVVNAPLTLSGPSSSFSGGVTLQGQTLIIGSNAALGTGTMTSNGGTISSNVSTLSLSNSWVFNATGGVTSTTFECNSHSCSSIVLGSAVVSGSSGTVGITNDVGATISFTSFNIPSGTTLQLSAGSGISIGSFGSGSGNLIVGGDLTIASSTSSTFAGNISDLSTGAGALIIAMGSSSTVTLSGNNTFSDGVTLTSGTLSVSSSSNLGSSSGTFTGNGGTLYNSTSSAITMSNPWVFDGGTTTAFNGAFTLTGPLSAVSEGTGALNTATISNAGGGLTLTPSSLTIPNGVVFVTNGTSIDLLGPFGTGDGTLALGGSNKIDTLTIASSSPTTFSGSIANASVSGAQGFVIVNSNVSLTGNNTFSGGLQLGVGDATSNTAILEITNNNAVGSGTIYGNGASLDTSNSFTISNLWTFSTGTAGATTFDVSNTVSNSGNIQTQTMTLSGNLTTTDPSNPDSIAYLYNIGSGNLTVKSSSICGYYSLNSTGGTLTWNSSATCSSTSMTTMMLPYGVLPFHSPLLSSDSVVNIVATDGLVRGIGAATNVTLQNRSAIAPGEPSNPFAEFHIEQSLTWEPGSYFVLSASNDDSAIVTVGDTATINSNVSVNIVPVNGYYTPSEHIILTANAIEGQFNSLVLTPDISFLAAGLTYDINSITLTLTPLTITGSSTIHGHNAQEVAEVLDEMIVYNQNTLEFTINCCPISVDPTTPPVLEDVLVSLRPLVGSSEMSSALNQLQPALFKGLTILQENAIVGVQQSVQRRQEYIVDTTSCYNVSSCTDPGACDREKTTWKLWVDVRGQRAIQHSTWFKSSPQLGYNSQMTGFTTGLDAHFAKYFYLGVLGGYTSSFASFHHHGGTGNIQTGYVGLYLSGVSDMFYGSMGVIGGFNNFSGNRNIAYTGVHKVAKHTNSGKQLLSYADTGINIDVLGWFKVRPFDSFSYITGSEDSYTERGAGGWDLHVGSKNTILLRNELGLQLSSCLCFESQKWIITPKASFVREVRIKGGRFTTSFAKADSTLYLPFSVDGYFPDRSLFSPGLSINGSLWKDLLGVEVYYNGEFSGGYANHMYGGQIRCSF